MMSDRAAKTKSVLFLCPHLTERGGVAHYYQLVYRHFRPAGFEVQYYFTGRRTSTRGRLRGFVTDFLALLRTVPRHDLIVLNPSLDPKSLLRDGCYHLMAKRLFNKRTAVFFRGWQPACEKAVDWGPGRLLFRTVFNADRMIILCRRFRDVFVRWGVPEERIVLETTTYEQHEVTECGNDPRNIVFLSRFAPGKGCAVALRSMELLVAEFPDIKLYMVGDGELMPELAEYARRQNLERNVEFTGWLEGMDKSKLLASCGVMLYPTGYGEGLPNAVLEGMGMGLAVVTRPVAGLADVITEGENGFLVSGSEPEEFAERVRYLLLNREAWRSISEHNRRVARERFHIESVVARLDRLYGSLL